MSSLQGFLTVPGDKSISHRALIFSAFAEGRVQIDNLSPAHDVRSTADCLKKLGLTVVVREVNGIPSTIEIESGGISSLKEPSAVLDAGNSGTTMRLLAGLVAGRPFVSRFDGDESLRRRTMKRVIQPLSEMGARVRAAEDMYAPFEITGHQLYGKNFSLAVASAQVEACILLAGLQARGETVVTAPYTVRDHTRRMMSFLAIPFHSHERTIGVSCLTKPISPYHVTVPSDISSAAFFMVAAALTPGSDLTLQAVGTNPGRTLIVDVLRSMGAEIEISNNRELCGEPVSDVRVRYRGPLSGVSLRKEEIARGIDEIPILSLAGALSQGTFEVSGAEELRHKESDRIKALCANLLPAGVDVVERPDGFVITGKRSIPGGSVWSTKGDHRLAMTGMIASLVFEQEVEIDDRDCMSVSYPGFAADLSQVLSN